MRSFTACNNFCLISGITTTRIKHTHSRNEVNFLDVNLAIFVHIGYFHLMRLSTSAFFGTKNGTGWGYVPRHCRRRGSEIWWHDMHMILLCYRRINTIGSFQHTHRIIYKWQCERLVGSQIHHFLLYCRIQREYVGIIRGCPWAQNCLSWPGEWIWTQHKKPTFLEILICCP